jgi:mannose-1-phosphate guanylyltransferase
MEQKNNYVVIMAGGIGSRFWPVSRNAFPKQFLDFLGTGKSLLQLTFERFQAICPKENILIVSNEQYAAIIKEQLPEISDEQVLLEPQRKNTAPCIAYASLKILLKNPKANIIVAASDHYILKESVYLDVLRKGLEYVTKHNHLLTIGIQPTRPDTGYGYIQYLDENENGIHKVKTFFEKPNKELAEQFIKTGEFLWNSGMFLFNAKTIIKAFETYLPEVFEAFAGYEKKLTPKDEKKFIENAYTLCTNISIDVGVMEKATGVRVIPASFGWSDVGTWASLYELTPHDYHGNSVAGKNVMTYDAHNNIINVPDKKLVIVQGLENYIIVDTPDALLICDKSNEQKIKDFTADVKRMKGDKFL